MKAIILGLLLLVSGVLVAQTLAPGAKNPDISKGLKQYFFGFLVKGEKWSEPLAPKKNSPN